MPDSVERALWVDLDGTPIRTDLLLEGILALLPSRPLRACMIAFWLLRGKAALKREIAKRVDIEPATLPYRRPLLEHLEKESATGRRLVLATASPIKFAKAIAEHLGLFSRVVATDGGENLVEREKAKRLCALFGEKSFDYAGNSPGDVAVWRCSAEAILVNSSGRMRQQIAASTKVAACFHERAATIGTYVRAIPLHQWRV
jgi:phosphoserine phosphatase